MRLIGSVTLAIVRAKIIASGRSVVGDGALAAGVGAFVHWSHGIASAPAWGAGAIDGVRVSGNPASGRAAIAAGRPRAFTEYFRALAHSC